MRLTRRQFLIGASGLGLLGTGLLTACAGPAATPTATTAPAAPKPTSAPAAPAATSAPAAPAAKPTEAPKPAAGAPQRGGSLRAVLSSEPTSLSPLVARTTFDRTAMMPILDTLFEYDEQYNPVPMLAQSVDVLPDLKTYVFKMRQGVEWHDGKPFTSEDVKDTVEALQAPDVPGAAILRRLVKDAKVSAPDKQTVRLELPQPNGALLDAFTDLRITRKDYDEKKPIGTGPFKFVEWARNQHVKYVRNEKYFKPGIPYLDELTLIPTPDETQAVNLLLNGQVDTIDKVALPRIKDVEASGKAQVIFLSSDYNLPFYLFMMNNAQAPFDRVEVRQAINLAIDREALLGATFGYGSVRSNQVPKGHWAFHAGAPSYNKRDVAKAKQLLAQAGAGPFTTTLTYHLLANEFAQFAQIIQANLAEVGITVNLKLLEVGLWVDEVLRAKTYTMAMTWNVPGWDPDSLLGGWTRSDGASLNWKRTADYEDLLLKGASVVAVEQRKPFYDKAQELVFTEVPGAVINEKATMVAAATKVKGFMAQLRGHTLYDKVWIQR